LHQPALARQDRPARGRGPPPRAGRVHDRPGRRCAPDRRGARREPARRRGERARARLRGVPPGRGLPAAGRRAGVHLRGPGQARLRLPHQGREHRDLRGRPAPRRAPRERTRHGGGGPAHGARVAGHQIPVRRRVGRDRAQVSECLRHREERPMSYAPGSLVAARGREWVVQPGGDERFILARPLNGDPDFEACLFAHEVSDATFPPPTADEVGDNSAAGLLRTALRIGFTSSAGPFRSLASIAVEPRQYQLVPLLLALRMPTVRLLIGDDVGIGKTIESCLIAKELMERGEANGLTVLCSPALAEQGQAVRRDTFASEAGLVLPPTAARPARALRLDEATCDRHPVTVVSLDFIKSARRYQQFVRTCPNLVIVDEAHTCVAAGTSSRQRQLRYRLLQELAADRDRHLILVTATPHSGDEEAFRNLIGLLDPKLATLDLDDVKGRETLARHFVQRRRRDIRRYLDQDTPFPCDRQVREVGYSLTGEYAKLTR